MGRALPHILALLLGVAAALVIGCGDRSNLIPGDAANDIKDQLAAVQQAVDRGDCAAALAAIDRASARYQQLPSAVDERLRKRIGDGIRALRSTAPTDCQNVKTQTETTQTVTTPTVTETVPTVTQTTPAETTPTQTTPTQTTPTETVPSETTPPASTVPNGGTPGAPSP